MDSGNSVSLQSSTSADEGECHSRSAVNDSILITNHHHIDHQNQILNPFLFSSSQLLDLDPIIWSKTLPAAAHVDHSVSSSELNVTAITPSTNPVPTSNRNPKKRSRASRRAPTTVLTTNTNNFRAMVQEFTGIPSPPFTSTTSSHVFPTISTSVDLFGRPSTVMRSNINNFDNHLPQQPSYLLPQKLVQSSSSSIVDPCYLLNAMQNPMITFPSNSQLDQSPFLNPKTTENCVVTNRIFNGGIRQTQIEDHRVTLHDDDLVTFQQTPQSSPPEK